MARNQVARYRLGEFALRNGATVRASLHINREKLIKIAAKLVKSRYRPRLAYMYGAIMVQLLGSPVPAGRRRIAALNQFIVVVNDALLQKHIDPVYANKGGIKQFAYGTLVLRTALHRPVPPEPDKVCNRKKSTGAGKRNAVCR